MVPLAAEVYLDACATSPPAPAVLAAMADAAAEAWANPSSLHGFGLAAAERLERSRISIATHLGVEPDRLVFVSGGSEANHAALLGMAARMQPGRLLISAVEHPALAAAAAGLQARGWQVRALPVDRRGVVRLDRFEELLQAPTRLVSMIWGQSEVGALQPIEAIGARCRAAGVPFHTDAVQVVGHRSVNLGRLPVDLLSLTAHKLQGPRGIGALVLAPGVEIDPLIGGGGQEGGRRGGTESVALAAGFAAALDLAAARLYGHGGLDPLLPLRDRLLETLLGLEGVRLSGPDPADPDGRLPHHISLLVSDAAGRPLAGRALVRALWRHGYAVSSGSACSSSARGSSVRISSASTAGPGGDPQRLRPDASPVLLAMGYSPEEAASGLRLSLGPWLCEADLEGFPAALQQARADLAAVSAGCDGRDG
ncbi:aminotransferase class V-fold PLP-dependent enzyme [Synechococcus sp. CCY9201]|uniref:cysteine desulfurase family protein n=1 Tax=unclassified Synechococcus TaxID=2626047 RepID=UPI002AD51827|nr:aminotransferase class V-fold PLP-dependent enzyme [Synechococcus sp. CBW1107]MEA5474994.1 aminotransferase class V-fold PLP-dependent enzyme [Synechococcus sp. CCY9201]CAK6694243.1 Cysteine desulfurase IscS [Synechococcus sp. CBW1107]